LKNEKNDILCCQFYYYGIANSEMDVQNINPEEYSPLMWACYEGDRDWVDELLKEGASVEERDKWGWTPLLHACCAERNGYIIRTLISHGANVDAAGEQGETPLMVTFKYGSLNERELRIGKSNLDAVDVKGRTALMYACDEGDDGQQLCYGGARVDIIDEDGRSALDHALESEHDNLEIVHTIVRRAGGLKTASEENDRILRDLLLRWVREYVQEIEESRSKTRHRWGGHPERFILRENSYHFARRFMNEGPEDEFCRMAPLIYACLNGMDDLILELCSRRGSFFSPDYKNEESLKYLEKYQEDMEKLANDCRKTDGRLDADSEIRRKILFDL